MSPSALPRATRTRRRIAAAALVVALPLTTAAGCQDEAEPGMEQEDGVEQEGGMDQEDGEEGDD